MTGRQERKITYHFFEEMFQVVIAMLCGMKIWHEIEVFGEENLEWGSVANFKYLSYDLHNFYS